MIYKEKYLLQLHQFSPIKNNRYKYFEWIEIDLTVLIPHETY